MNQIVEIAAVVAGGVALIPVVAALLAQAQPKRVPVRVRRDR